jgi:hypothetical protein
VAEAIAGSTTQNIAAEPPIKTGRPRTGLGALRAAIPLPTARLARGNSLGDGAAICRVPAAGELA